MASMDDLVGRKRMEDPATRQAQEIKRASEAQGGQLPKGKTTSVSLDRLKTQDSLLRVGLTLVSLALVAGLAYFMVSLFVG